ncbi:MAG TPA: polysaccharide deacetylase family protein [Pyrinomonadaceae bacterium]|nr:polysaccharide deacetylase family protein [Acidobacteriota bacterium]HQZ96546.1 polysaccharide deacetylase family protein [Pyrinomonadaceae bacterium]
MKFIGMIFVAAMAAISISGQPTNRTVAITIDDLPVVSTRSDLKNRQQITKKLIGHITKAKVPAIAFVNENKLYAGDKRDEKQIDLLRMWLVAGLELGNHTFSHRSLNQIPIADYEADLMKGETITKELLGEKGREIRFFRHPFLQTGRTLETKAQFDAFLSEHGYRIAPITFDNADYIFSRAYDVAFDKNDKKLMKQVGNAYVPYMEKKLEYWERQSMKLFGREMSQTLLIHANFINSDYFDDLAAMFKRRAYKFVDLETALKDDAYRLPDKFTGGAGISWLHRWALDRGRENVLPDEPMVPEFVLKLSGFESE